MAESDQTPSPEDPPVNTGEDEVERLLDQAQELADDITTTAAEESDPPDHEAATPIEGDPADPIAATDAVEKRLTELSKLVEDPGSSEAEQPPVEPATDEEIATPGSVDGSPPDSESPHEAPGPEIGEMPSDDQLDADVSVDLGEPGEKAEPGGEQPAEPRPRPSPKESLVAALVSVRSAAGAAADLVRQAISAAFISFDRPFANLSSSTKRYLGYAAIVTVAMGLASFVLPGLCESNPYENMGP